LINKLPNAELTGKLYGIMGAKRLIMRENLPLERLVRKALRAEEPIGRPGIRQLGIPQGAKRLEERPA
jgi:hypothetical protein